MKKYVKKPISVMAKIFEKGDQDGFVKGENGENVPYVTTGEGRQLYAEFGNHYIVYGNHNDKWLVQKQIFEDTYECLDL